jgi:hypothetical protein
MSRFPPLNLSPLGDQTLLGRDILDLCLFFYNGPGRSTFALAS